MPEEIRPREISREICAYWSIKTARLFLAVSLCVAIIAFGPLPPLRFFPERTWLNVIARCGEGLLLLASSLLVLFGLIAYWNEKIAYLIGDNRTALAAVFFGALYITYVIHGWIVL